MKMLSKVPSLEEYNRDITQLLNSSNTHFFLDNSFLMWLTVLGERSRAEFFNWVHEIGEDRFHVPLWASHEYHQHFLNQTLLKQVNNHINELETAAQSFYKNLSPVIAEAEDPPRWSSSEIKNRSREAILDLMKFGQVMKKWNTSTFPDRYSAIINFINKQCLTSGVAFEYFNNLNQTTDSRYSGRVPPGFQDSVKKDTQVEGGNRSGDLIFWKEILDHAKESNKYFRRIKSIVILSNDRKNDWVIGGKPVTTDGSDDVFKNLRLDWSQIPVIHPMLEHEAQTYSRVKRVTIVNGFSLGAHFFSKNSAPNFVESTITTVMPSVSDEKKSSQTQSPAKTSNDVSKTSVSPTAPAQSKKESSTAATLTNESTVKQFELSQMLLYLPPSNKIEVEKIIDEMFDLKKLVTTSVSHWISRESSLIKYPINLIWVVRLLTERASNQDANASQRIIDILGVIEELDLDTATIIYAGLLFGVYYDRENQMSVGVKPDFLQRIFLFKSRDFAKVGLEVLNTKLKEDATNQIYFPDSSESLIEAETTIKNNSLTSLVINNVDYLTPLDKNDPHSLINLLGLNESTFSAKSIEIINIAAIKLGFPLKQLKITGDLQRKISFEPDSGLKIPF